MDVGYSSQEEVRGRTSGRFFVICLVLGEGILPCFVRLLVVYRLFCHVLKRIGLSSGC